MRKNQDKEKLKYHNLFNLYGSFVLQRSTIIILIISLILITGLLYYIANPFFDTRNYLDYSYIYHRNYFKLGLFIIQLFNSIIVAVLSTIIVINSKDFDKLFIANVKRINICITKILVVIFILFIISTIETLIFYLLPIIIYPSYTFDISYLLLIPYIYITLIFELFIEMALLSLINNQFISPILSFIFIGIRLLCDNVSNISLHIKQFYPIIYYDNLSESTGVIPAIFISILFLVLYLTSYNIKDIN